MATMPNKINVAAFISKASADEFLKNEDGENLLWSEVEEEMKKK
jgi:hypothetical protein